MGSDFTVKWVKTNSGKFQSTLPYGERRRLVPNGKVVKVFQSTLPYGERPRKDSGVTVRYGFNPRSRMGSDLAVHRLCRVKPLFQSTLPYGERPSGFHPPLRPAVFQSTLPYGERRWTFIIILSLRGFQSTLPYGERPSVSVPFAFTALVSIHAPVWGATLRGR